MLDLIVVSCRYASMFVWCLSLLTSGCALPSLGVETGNPNGRIIQGKFDDAGNSEATSVLALSGAGTSGARLTDLSSACNNAATLEIEARATDVSGSVRAPIENNQFDVSVEQDKAYVFVVFGDDDPCGYVVFNDSEDITTQRPERAVVGPGTEDIDLGTLFQYSDTFVAAWAASDNPAMISDIDGDGLADARDDDVNGDGVIDFDGNYDGFINVEDVADTTVAGDCDILTILGRERAETGTVTKNGTADLILTATRDFAAFDGGKATLYDVDGGEFVDVGSSFLVDDDTATISLDVTTDRDYVLTLPVGTFSCTGGTSQEREVSTYFRVVDVGIECSFGSDC